MKELVRSEVFEKVYHRSMLAQYMKTNLYKEWIDTNNINMKLEEKSGNYNYYPRTVTPVNEKLNYMIK